MPVAASIALATAAGRAASYTLDDMAAEHGNDEVERWDQRVPVFHLCVKTTRYNQEAQFKDQTYTVNF